MALDRQRILSELGSVMNQLKSADCGCMGKLFGNSGQITSQTPYPNYGGCRRGYNYGHSCGWNSNGTCGDPYSNYSQNKCSPCMGRCNPPKLYADTYNYLTENLMQPTIQEVYSDLKSLTPENTVLNNPMASQIGLSNTGAPGTAGDLSNQYAANHNFKTNPIDTGNAFRNDISQQPNANSMNTNSDPSGQMSGMGPQIMNMLGGNMQNPNTNKSMEPKGQLSGSMLIDAPQSPHGQVGITPLTAPIRTNYDAYNSNVQGYPNAYNGTQVTPQSDLQPGRNAQNTINTNPAAQQMAAAHHHSHGPHSQGVAKFNEMFPGVMTGLGGDLGFDPMAIAIQMNPANHQQAAMNTMNKMMQNNEINKVFDHSTKPANLQANATHPNSPAPNIEQQTERTSVHPNIIPSSQMTFQNNRDQKTIDNNANIYGTSNAHPNNQQVYMSGSVAVPNQQANMNQSPNNQTDKQQLQNPLQYYQQAIIDPNTGSTIAPPTFPAICEDIPHGQHLRPESSNIQQTIKEPIFPADTSRYLESKRKYEYNTLGQPVEMLSAKMYRPPEIPLPQTLSPQSPQKLRLDQSKYSKVKSTVSKTSIMGSKPIGRTPSQLQQIYNQYKGSQSYTQQNIATPVVNTVTHSEGKLNAPQTNLHHIETPVEKVGGDTSVNKNIHNERAVKVEQVMGHLGDVPSTIKPVPEGIPEKVTPVQNPKCRNGLQDLVYTSYPSSAAWSFHGANTVPYVGGRRYRKNY